MLKPSTDTEIFMSFIKESKLLAYVGNHENVVKFHGAMVEKLAESKEWSIVELYLFSVR